ncbi:MAG: arylsulfotransferase family protein [Bacteroidales bacterium]|nr:arylsulfotransferase family protein [Bacteroidales bacterium]MCF8333559.1 arylsulfotransferase family protein [Bacteroidales bacterium]
MKKVLKTFSIVIIVLFILSIFGWMVSNISKGEKKYGFLTEPIKYIYTFPDLFSQSVEEVKTLPKTFVKTPGNFQSVNKLEADFTVLSTYSDTSGNRSIVLQNLKNDSILYKWKVNNPHKATQRIKNPILLPEKNLIYSYRGKSLKRIDSLGNVVWTQDSIWAHHSLTRDSNGDIWACAAHPVYYSTAYYKFHGKSVFIKDNYITKVDPKTGKTLFHKSVAELMAENNLTNYLIKSMQIKDPIHINDIQPALKTTKYYKKGDVFISARQPSIVMHYRPSTNKVVEVIEGPFVSQHDVDFLNDSTLAIFNNNANTLSRKQGKGPPKDSSRLVFMGDLYSNIVRYHLPNDSVSFIGDSIFRTNNIFTYTEGLMEFVGPSTYFVEEQNSGLIWIIKDDEVIYKNVLESQHEGYHHLPNWIRVIDYDK